MKRFTIIKKEVSVSIKNKVEYAQISNDWRHRDNLTWQIPSVIVAIGGALITVAFTPNIGSEYTFIRPILLGFGAFLSLCLTFALIQNLWYQVGSEEALMKIVNGEKLVIKKEKPRRTINPEDLNISKGDVINRLFTGLTGSTFLVLLCIGITVILFILFIQTFKSTLVHGFSYIV